MESYQTRLNERRVQFAQKTAQRMPEVESMLERLSHTPDDLQTLADANKFFHQLAGAGGIYEMADLCDSSIAAEEVCLRVLEAEKPISLADLELLSQSCRQIAAICAKTSKPHGD
jgi:hypothetical protein